MKQLRVQTTDLRYTGIVGTGGLGSGKFFELNGNHTLGREESRSGHFLDVRDYCKQHIILHYIKVLLGSDMSVIPIGKLGRDDLGDILHKEMETIGFTMRHVERIHGLSTLFSFCFHYPDGKGGNLTTDNSASANVNSDFIEKAAGEIMKLGSRGMMMAAPEVPLDARRRLLEIGRKAHAFCSASFTSEEIRDVFLSGMMEHVDLLAINLDEAAALTGQSADEEPMQIVQRVVEQLMDQHKGMFISVTAGSEGSWCWDGEKPHFCPAIKTSIESTAGAGDAFFSGLLTGLATGHSIEESQYLATLLAGLSVTSPHTIHPGIDQESLNAFRLQTNFKCPEKISNLLNS